jgi:hypothetical protein
MCCPPPFRTSLTKETLHTKVGKNGDNVACHALTVRTRYLDDIIDHRADRRRAVGAKEHARSARV